MEVFFAPIMENLGARVTGRATDVLYKPLRRAVLLEAIDRALRS
jgi:FixJ family two-component response regulator